MVLFGLFDTAEADERLAASLLWCKTALYVFLDGKFEMRCHLGVEVLIERCFAEEGSEAMEGVTEGVHELFTPLCLHSEHALHHACESLPIGGVLLKLLPSLAGDRVELCLAIVVGGSPLGGDAFLLLESHQRGVDGPLVKKDFVAAHLLDTPCDAVSVQCAHRLARLQNHQVQRSLQ